MGGAMLVNDYRVKREAFAAKITLYSAPIIVGLLYYLFYLS